MTQLTPLQALHIANILRKSISWQIQAYEQSILQGPEDEFTHLCLSMKQTEEMELRMIEGLIEFIKSQHKTSCKHPKKMQDTDPNGLVYCMKCGDDV